jgi:hypothetical protein
LTKFAMEQLFRLGTNRVVRDNTAKRAEYLRRQARRESRKGLLPGARMRSRPWVPTTIRQRSVKEIDFKSLGRRKRKAMEKDKRKNDNRQQRKREHMSRHSNKSLSSDRYELVDMDVKGKVRAHRRIPATEKRELASDRAHYDALLITSYRGVVVEECYEEYFDEY